MVTLWYSKMGFLTCSIYQKSAVVLNLDGFAVHQWYRTPIDSNARSDGSATFQITTLSSKGNLLKQWELSSCSLGTRQGGWCKYGLVSFKAFSTQQMSGDLCLLHSEDATSTNPNNVVGRDVATGVSQFLVYGLCCMWKNSLALHNANMWWQDGASILQRP